MSLDNIGVPGFRKAQPPNHSPEMSIDDDGGLPETVCPYDMRGFSPDSRERKEFLHSNRNDTLVHIGKKPCGIFDKTRLLVKKAHTVDDLLQFCNIRRTEGSRVGIALKEPRSDRVDLGIGTLGGEDHRNCEFETVLEENQRLTVGINTLQFCKDRKGLFDPLHSGGTISAKKKLV